MNWWQFRLSLLRIDGNVVKVSCPSGFFYRARTWQSWTSLLRVVTDYNTTTRSFELPLCCKVAGSLGETGMKVSCQLLRRKAPSSEPASIMRQEWTKTPLPGETPGPL
ncbi:hypothetical protein BO85DRAFT_448229, partial [Aspergillus piperis CBS 112811]